MDSTSSREYHLDLVSTYIFRRVFYSMSLQRRVCYDLGYIHFYISSYDKELDALSDEELEKRLSSIVKPLWYDKYEYINKRSKRLLRILYFFPTIRVVNILYKILKQNEYSIDKENKLSDGMQYNCVVLFYLRKQLGYSLPFRERVGFDLEIVDYLLDTEDKELNTLSYKGIREKTKSLKAPWWNKLYETFLGNHTFLLAITWLLLNPRILLRILKSKEPKQ